MAYGSIRGAITVEKDDREAILEATRLLLAEMMQKNQLDPSLIISLLFTATRDLTQAYPAVAAREMGISQAALMCVQEMFVEGSLEKCIRVQMNIETERKQCQMRHVYMREAEKLRPDLVCADTVCTEIEENVPVYAIAIDGPCGAGKSTIAKMVAASLGYIYVDTGAMYRATALYCLNNHIDLEELEAVEGALSELDISIGYAEGAQRIFLHGVDVTDAIRTTVVADGASKVAVSPKVREKLVQIQQQLAEKESVVMDGRDIGTKVLPNATLKVYLDASVLERAKRRVGEFRERGFEPDLETVRKEIEERDHRDIHREVSPLRKAEDALVLDSSAMTREAVAQAIEDVFCDRIK